jgi:iron(III) transport system permease protein
LISLMDYTIPSLFQVNVYSLEIFAQYSADYDSSKAFLLSLPLLLSAIPAAMLFQWAFRNAALSNTRGDRKNSFKFEAPVFLVFLQGLALVISVLQFSVPVISLILSTGTPLKLVNAFLSSYHEIGFSILLSVLAATIAVFFGTMAASGMNRKGHIYKICWIFILLPFAIPAPLTGIALVKGWNIFGAYGARGTILLHVMAGVIRFLPFAALILLAIIKRLDPRLLEASRIQQKNTFHGLVKVYIPMLSKGLAAAGCLVFILTAGELGATMIVTPPGSGTITMKIYNYMHYGASDSVAALCLIMLVLSLIAGAAGFAALMHSEKGFKRR